MALVFFFSYHWSAMLTQHSMVSGTLADLVAETETRGKTQRERNGAARRLSFLLSLLLFQGTDADDGDRAPGKAEQEADSVRGRGTEGRRRFARSRRRGGGGGGGGGRVAIACKTTCKGRARERASEREKNQTSVWLRCACMQRRRAPSGERASERSGRAVSYHLFSRVRPR